MKKNKNQGFTLVEIIVTITVFAIILPAVVGLMTSLTTINDRARELALVHAAAQNKVEELRSQGFIAVEEGGCGDPGHDFSDTLPSTLGQSKSACYAVGLVDASDPSLKEITVTISYNDRGETRTLKYKTYLGELGVGQY